MDIENLLKEATQDVLTPETLKAITEAVESKAQEKADLIVEAKLAKQDEEYATKLQTILEAIDNDHSEKLNNIVATIDAAHAKTLTKIVEGYDKKIQQDAETFKENVLSRVSDFIESYIDEKIPAKQIQESAENIYAQNALSKIKDILHISAITESKELTEAFQDGKKQISEALASKEKVILESKKLESEVQKLKAKLALETRVSMLPESKRAYIRNVLGDKTEAFICENFDYIAKLSDKDEERKIEKVRATTASKVLTENVDTPKPVVEDKQTVVTESNDQFAYINDYIKGLE